MVMTLFHDDEPFIHVTRQKVYGSSNRARFEEVCEKMLR